VKSRNQLDEVVKKLFETVRFT